MATVDELLAMRDLLARDNEIFVADTKYPVYTLYSDPVYVTINNKTIADFNSQISIRGEQNAQYISFVMPRYSDGVDLVNMQLFIHYESSQGGNDNTPCNVEYSAASIHLSWLVPAAAAQSAEAIQFMIYALGYNEKGEPYKWLTLPARYEIKDGLEIGGSIAEPDTGWYEQFVWSMDNKISTALGHANTAKGYASNAKTSQTAASQSATAAAKTQADVKTYVESEKASFIGFSKRETDLKYANAIIGSAEGKGEATLSNVWNAPVQNLCIYGESRQDTTTGAQLFDQTLYKSRTSGGVTIRNNDNGSFTISDIATKTVDLYLMGAWESTVVLFSGQCSFRVDGLSNEETLYVINVTSGKSAVGTSTISYSGDITAIMVRFKEGKNYDNLTFWPMLYKTPTDSSIPAWEPYTGGIPAPNPDFPQKIQNVGDGEALVVVSSVGGRNLATGTNNGISNWDWILNGGDYTSEVFIDSGVRCCKLIKGDIPEGSYNVIYYKKIGRENYIPNTYYTVSFDVMPNIDAALIINLTTISATSGLVENLVKVNITSGKWNKCVCLFKTRAILPSREDQVLYIQQHNSNAGDTYIFKNVKIECGGTATPWTPAPEDITDSNKAEWLPFISKATLPVTLRGIDDVRDKLCWKDGIWGIERNILLVDNNTWLSNNVLEGTSGHRYRTPSLRNALSLRGVKVLCSKYNQKTLSSYSMEGDYISTDEIATNRIINIRTLNPDFEDIMSFKEMMSDSETMYILSVPTWEPLPDDIQQQLNELITYSGSTSTVYVIGTDIVPDMSVEYVKDTNKVIGNLQGQIDKLTNMIVAD